MSVESQMELTSNDPSRSAGLLILEKLLPLFTSHLNQFILSNGKHP